MEALVRNLKIVWRTESMIAERRKDIVMRQIGFLAIAGLVAVFSLAMLDVAAFFALRPVWGDARAALAVGLGNMLIAVIVAYYARGIVEGPEMRPVREVRDMAIEELAAEAAHVQTEIKALRDEVKNVEQSVRSFVKNPMDALSPTILMPLISAALKALRTK